MASGDSLTSSTGTSEVAQCEVVREKMEIEEREENERLQLASKKFSHKLPGEKVYRGMLLNEVGTACMGDLLYC